MARGVPRVPRGPLMKATLEKHVGAEPSEFHYRAAKRALLSVGISCDRVTDIPRAANVKDLAIWVDTVLWCAGEGNARNALLDRMMAKEARLIVNAEVSARANLAHNNAEEDTAADYMAMLEESVKSK